MSLVLDEKYTLIIVAGRDNLEDTIYTIEELKESIREFNWLNLKGDKIDLFIAPYKATT